MLPEKRAIARVRCRGQMGAMSTAICPRSGSGLSRASASESAGDQSCNALPQAPLGVAFKGQNSPGVVAERRVFPEDPASDSAARVPTAQ